MKVFYRLDFLFTRLDSGNSYYYFFKLDDTVFCIQSRGKIFYLHQFLLANENDIYFLSGKIAENLSYIGEYDSFDLAFKGMFFNKGYRI